MDDLIFNTGNNYLKRSLVLKKSITLAPDAYAFGDIAHDLGYVPAARVYYEIGGKLTEAYGKVSINANMPPFNGIYVNHKIKKNVVSYTAQGSGNSTRTINIIVVIYLDDVA